MSDIAIRCEGLSKQYRIGERESYKALRDVIADAAASPFRRLRSVLGNTNGAGNANRSNSALSTQHSLSTHDSSLITHHSSLAPDTRHPTSDTQFWALDDVSFEVKRGEVVGIIGRNGAGKSTLLKILSRITKPTKGHATINGRVGSLLEVGTGFHPELTGRENIYLNAAILGMRKAEVESKFDEIVAFAEVEKFIDTPVKRYSSGMYVRLAFAVAAHMETEVLVVDEVLAVGDVQFQMKCLGKMGEVAKQGRTVVFVSHNMSTVQNLCSHCIYLKAGRNVFEGPADDVVTKYLAEIQADASSRNIKERRDRAGSGRAKVTDFYVLDKNRKNQTVLRPGEDYFFVMEYEKTNPREIITNVVGSIAFTDSRNEIVYLVRSNFSNENVTLPIGSSGRIECHITDFNLAKGTYNSYIFLSHADVEVLDQLENASEIIVEGGDFFGTGNSGLPTHCRVLTRSHWVTT
jgi:lipopolysaccharide transport system ATP-binding protein